MLDRQPDATAAVAPLPDKKTADPPRSSFRPRSSPRPRLRIQPRYYAILELLYRCRVLTDAQIAYALFPPGNASGARRTLPRLVANKWIDRLPRLSNNHPYPYLLTSRSTVGNKILKDKYGDEAFAKQLYNYHPLEHFLALNDVRIRAEKDAPVDVWAWPEQLVSIIGPKLQPDAYFRALHGQVRAGYFVEMQRALKTHKILLSKLARYQTLFASEPFVNRPMKALVVFTTEYNRTGQQRVTHALKNTPDRYPFLYVTSLDAIKALPVGQFYTAPIWYQSGGFPPRGLIQ